MAWSWTSSTEKPPDKGKKMAHAPEMHEPKTLTAWINNLSKIYHPGGKKSIEMGL